MSDGWRRWRGHDLSQPALGQNRFKPIGLNKLHLFRPNLSGDWVWATPSPRPPSPDTLRRTAQNFALFCTLPPQFSFLLPSLVEFWWPGPSMCTFELSGDYLALPPFGAAPMGGPLSNFRPPPFGVSTPHSPLLLLLLSQGPPFVLMRGPAKSGLA